MSVTSHCEEIEEERFLCPQDLIVQYYGETCIEQMMLLKSNLSLCHQNPITIEDTKVLKLTNGLWMLYARQEVMVTENCNDETHRQMLRGTYILSPTPGCDTVLGNIPIGATTNTSSTNVVMTPIQLPELSREINKDNRQLDLRGVDFRDIKDILNSVKYSGSVENESGLISSDMDVWTLLIYIVISILIITFLFYRYVYLLIIVKRNSPKSPATTSDNSVLREGGVKSDATPNISFVSRSASAD